MLFITGFIRVLHRWAAMTFLTRGSVRMTIPSVTGITSKDDSDILRPPVLFQPKDEVPPTGGSMPVAEYLGTVTITVVIFMIELETIGITTGAVFTLPAVGDDPL